MPMRVKPIAADPEHRYLQHAGQSKTLSRNATQAATSLTIPAAVEGNIKARFFLLTDHHDTEFQ